MSSSFVADLFSRSGETETNIHSSIKTYVLRIEYHWWHSANYLSSFYTCLSHSHALETVVQSKRAFQLMSIAVVVCTVSYIFLAYHNIHSNIWPYVYFIRPFIHSILLSAGESITFNLTDNDIFGFISCVYMRQRLTRFYMITALNGGDNNRHRVTGLQSNFHLVSNC